MIERSVLIVLVYYYKGMLEKVLPAILKYFFVTESPQLNTAHAW